MLCYTYALQIASTHTNTEELKMDKRLTGALSITQAMTYLGDIGRTKIYELIRRGELEVLRIDSKPIIMVEECEEFLARQRNQCND